MPCRIAGFAILAFAYGSCKHIKCTNCIATVSGLAPLFYASELAYYEPNLDAIEMAPMGTVLPILGAGGLVEAVSGAETVWRAILGTADPIIFRSKSIQTYGTTRATMRTAKRDVGFP